MPQHLLTESIKISILAPKSNTANNIYSMSEMIYMQKYFEDRGYVVETNRCLSSSDLAQNMPLFKNKIIVLVLQFETEDLFLWLEKYQKLSPQKTILYGISAITFGKLIQEEFGIGDVVIKSFSYKAIVDTLHGVQPQYRRYDIHEVDTPCFNMKELLMLPFIPIISSRGCGNTCSFCAFSCNDPCFVSYTQKDSNRLYSEVATYVNEYNKQSFYFVDSCFVTKSPSSIKRAKDFAKMVIKNKLRISFYVECRVDAIDYETFDLLRQAGLKRVLLGVENFNPSVLSRYNKRITNDQTIMAIEALRSLGINIDITLITINPETTRQELLSNVRFILDHDLSRYIAGNQFLRRLILLPGNHLGYKEPSYVEKDNIPGWYGKCRDYELNNVDVALFEQFMECWYPLWEQYVTEKTKREKNISSRMQLRQKLSKLLFIVLADILCLDPFPLEINCLIDYANLFIQRRSAEEMILTI